MKKTIKKRTRMYLAVEGESERSFVKFIGLLCAQEGMPVHLDCDILEGGGYRAMLERAISCRSRKEKTKGKAKKSIMIVDADRGEGGHDGWTIEKFQNEASKNDFTTYLQRPNLEGQLLRLFTGNERLQPSAKTVESQLSKEWIGYQKPEDAQTLIKKFTVDDLRRVARVDRELKIVLKIIGLIE